MTPDETDRILVRIIAAWNPMEPSTRAIWREHLAPMGFALAVRAVQQLEQTCTRRPSLAELNGAYRSCRPATDLMPALNAPEEWVGKEDAKEYVQIVREHLQASNADEFQRAARTRRGATKFLEGSPARRVGTMTGASPEFRPLRYEQVYDENGEPRS